MGTGTAVGSLIFVTLGIVLLLIIVALVWHIRKRSNRKPMEGIRERNFAEMKAGKPPEQD